MKSAFWRSLALALVAALVLPSIALAGGEVARSAMGGTNFMNTSADTWILFHRSLEGDGYGEFVSQGYNGNYNKGTTDHNDGFGRLILPFDDIRVGFEVNNRDAGSGLVGYSWNTGPFLGRGNSIGDFIYNADVSGNNAFWGGNMLTAKAAFAMGTGGASVGLGIYNDSYEDNDAPYKENSTGFSLNGSWGNGAPGTQGTIEVAGEFTTHSDKYEDTDTAEQSGNHFAANGRYSVSDDSHVEGAFFKLSSDYDDGFATPSTSDAYGITGLKLNYARDLVEEADHGALVEIAFDYMKQTYEEDGASEASLTTMTFPSCRFSAWHEIRTNWTLYGGVTAGYLFKNTEEDPDGTTGGSLDTDSDRVGDDSFSWTAGLGWDPNDHIGIEFFLMTSNLDNVASLGNTSPLIGGIGAHGSF
jgi:hypothetical protein